LTALKEAVEIYPFTKRMERKKKCQDSKLFVWGKKKTVGKKKK
jgi:hypothetical protein